MADIEIPQDEYIVIGAPQLDSLAKLLVEAKGEDRTMGDFARDCGIEPSTFSRIQNRKIKRALKRDVIDAIYTHSKGFLSYDSLMRANGMLNKSRLEGKSSEEQADRIQFANESNTYRNELAAIGNIVREEISKRQNNYAEREYNENTCRMFGCEYVESRYGTLEFFFKKLYCFDEPMNPRFMYLSIVDTLSYLESPSSLENFANLPDNKFLKRFMGQIYRPSDNELFFIDTWSPEALKDIRICFAVTDRRIFEKARKVFGDTVTVNNEFSIILVDLDQREIVSEYKIPTKSGEHKESIFDMPLLPPEK